MRDFISEIGDIFKDIGKETYDMVSKAFAYSKPKKSKPKKKKVAKKKSKKRAPRRRGY